MTATAAPEGMTEEENVIPEEKRPPVTQVVEVVEDETPQESPMEVPQVEEPPITEPPKEEQAETTKSMVEQLYSTERQPSVMPEISAHHRDGKKPFMVWAIVTIVVALLTGGILYSVSKKSSVSSFFARPTPTPTPAPTATPTPAPATIDKSTFSVQVLNGGGTVGAAGKMKSFLEGKGYKVSGTGNTDQYTYDTTEIHGKANMTDAVANLKMDLKDSYTLGTVAADLSASASADVQVIVGK